MRLKHFILLCYRRTKVSVNGYEVKNTLYDFCIEEPKYRSMGMRLKTLYITLLSENQSIGQWREVKNTAYDFGIEEPKYGLVAWNEYIQQLGR